MMVNGAKNGSDPTTWAGERTFQLYSPLIASIEVKRRGDVRRAKLYYLRDRSGKSARIREKLPNRRTVADAAE